MGIFRNDGDDPEGSSEQHKVPLSKLWLDVIACAAQATSADRSTYTGTLPGPTPYAGLPEL